MLERLHVCQFRLETVRLLDTLYIYLTNYVNSKKKCRHKITARKALCYVHTPDYRPVTCHSGTCTTACDAGFDASIATGSFLLHFAYSKIYSIPIQNWFYLLP